VLLAMLLAAAWLLLLLLLVRGLLPCLLLAAFP
jgi:hypothetical protein